VSSLTVTGPGSHGDFDHPDISWEDYTARHAQSRRFLQKMDNNFLLQVVEEPTRKGALLDLVLTKKEQLVEDVKAGGRLGCSNHEMVEFKILRGGSRVISKMKPWTSGDITLVSSRSYLEESRGPGLSKAGGSERAGCCLNITSSTLRSYVSS